MTGERNHDWDDRIVDLALRELHGERPPDLAAAVQARLERAGAAGRGPAPGPARRAPSVRALAVLLAAAAALLCAALLWPRPGLPERIAAVQVVVEVLAGDLQVLPSDPEAAPVVALRPGGPAAVVLRRGDRLRSSSSQLTEVIVGPFGMVRTEPRTRLEVQQMDVSLKNGWVAAGSLTFAVLAGAASWHLLTRQERAEAGEVLRIEAPAQSELTGQLAAAQAAGARLAEENSELKRRLAELETAMARRQAEPAPVAEEPPPPPAPAAGPVFGDERFAELLAEIDWEVMGRVAGEMAQPLLELARILEEGGELPMDLAVKIGALNMKLVEQLPAMLKAELPGAGPNGVWTHPLVVSNQIASLLQHGGQGLTEAQRTALGSLTRRFSAENEGIHATAAEFDLDRVVAEVAMKDRMYEELAAQLSPEQRALLHPEGSGAYDGISLFRSGLIWQAFAQPVSASTPEAYASSIAGQVQRRLGLDENAAAQMRRILDETARAAPREMWASGNGVERLEGGSRLFRSGRSMRAAQTQQLWMRRVLREVPLTPEQREKLRKLEPVFVPLPQ